MKYPEYVKKYRPKGTVVKLVHGNYYVYKATSRRLPDKKYPVQVIEGIAGKIDVYGFHPTTRVTVNVDQVTVRECGFTNYLLRIEKDYIREMGWNKKQGRIIYRSMIAYLSPNTYLQDETDIKIRTPEEISREYNVGIPKRMGKLRSMLEFEPEKLEPLKYICNVRTGGKLLRSTLTADQKRLIEELGVKEDEIR